jgi:2-amino-4-hydroxy-6-hydroxymethyldihydropteridine diphosphokinase
VKARIWFLLKVLDSRPGLLCAGVMFYRENDGIPREISTCRGACVCAPSSQVERNLDSIVNATGADTRVRPYDHPPLVMGSQNRSTKGHVAFLSLGSNVGDTRHHLKAARRALAALGVSLEDASACYATEPVDFKDQPWFLNQVIRVRTDLTPMELLQTCLRTEHQQGRCREIAKGPRTLDIDILLYDDLILQDPELQIPHPQIPLRRFVLEPLAALAPRKVHPILRDTFERLLAKCPDPSRVERLEESD